MFSWQETSKSTYERIATIAEALPETKREEFATLLDNLQSLDQMANRILAIRRWLADAGWPVTR